MAEYKLYILGPSGMITRGVWLDCDDDADAVEQARHCAWHDRRELWAGPRLVWTFVGEPQGVMRDCDRDRAPALALAP